MALSAQTNSCDVTERKRRLLVDHSCVVYDPSLLFRFRVAKLALRIIGIGHLLLFQNGERIELWIWELKRNPFRHSKVSLGLSYPAGTLNTRARVEGF